MKNLKQLFLVGTFLVSGLAQAEFISDEGLVLHSFRNSKEVQQEIRKQSEEKGLHPGQIDVIKVKESLRHYPQQNENRKTYLVVQHLIANPNAFHPFSSSVIASVTVKEDPTPMIQYRYATKPRLRNIGNFYMDAIYTAILTEKADTELVQTAVRRAHDLASEERLAELQDLGYEVVSKEETLLAFTSGFPGVSHLYLVVTELTNPRASVKTQYLVGIYYSDALEGGVRGRLYEESDVETLFEVKF